MLEIMNTQTLEVSHALGSSLLLSSSIVAMDETGYENGVFDNDSGPFYIGTAQSFRLI
ncbi:hypothetical protein NC652_037393 [Populus alba x Populus x berolinensis]|nr:hypothetical protein NC652_037393 [Populus alba x Populus x berolinensis]